MCRSVIWSATEPDTVTSTASVVMNEGTTLSIEFAFLLLFLNGKQSLLLTQYMGETQSSILRCASKFVLSPKPIDNSPDLVKDSCIRISNLTFICPSVEVFTSAMAVAESLTEFISHITLEQRLRYIKQQNRSCAIMVVQKWEVRRSYATSALNVAEIIKIAPRRNCKY